MGLTSAESRERMSELPVVVQRPPEDRTGANAADLALAGAVLARSEEAWHEFLDRYSRLIMAVIRRYYPGHRRDEASSLHASVLESLYRGKLSSYSGRASLSTWLVPITRSAVVDDVRRRLGGRELQDRLKALGTYERQVFKHYYLEGLSFGTVLRMVRDQGAAVTPDRLLLALQSIEDQVGGRMARRLRYDLHAQSVGAASGRLLEYLDHVRGEAENRERAQDPEYRLMEREARRTLDDIQAEVSRLPQEERRLLAMRFEQGWTAQRIAEELGLDGQRTVYTVLDRILRGIRRAIVERSPRKEPR